MKKFFDRYLFSRLGLQSLFAVLVILLFSLAGSMLRNWTTSHSKFDICPLTFRGFRLVSVSGARAGT